jgi:hypothetical protein
MPWFVLDMIQKIQRFEMNAERFEMPLFVKHTR